MTDVTSHTIPVPGAEIHCVQAGSGPAVVLLHGFPQDWWSWRRVMPLLADRFTLVAVDQRGVGASSAPADGYDAVTLASDVYAVVEALGLGPVHVVGHDIGGWVAYALARLHPSALRTVTVLETLLPGVEPFATAELVGVPLWHGEFHMIPGLPEALVTDRQEVYFRYFFDVGTLGAGVITDAEVAHYASAYGDAAHLRAGFEVYRALPADIAFSAGQTSRVDVPLLLAGSTHVFGPALPAVAANLRAHFGWTSVSVETLSGGRHYLPDEQPAAVASLIASHAARG